ncbi:2,3-dihydroxyphenylpropionate 1,2-dioxygenase [Streptomyces sp. NPDC085927]|uniref:DODA-type extradiol aromatic ring-opening family dioxygenase n=1 Tax=Streptomyces sp. NPDC085927 TaxID=3365738 RepID=UPI0037D10E06
MSEIVGFAALSHSPFWNGSFPAEATPETLGARFTTAAARLRDLVADLAPDAVVIFGPDHFRNFFLDVMPSFCVGVGEIVGCGDYGTHKGAVPHAEGIGRHIAESAQAAGFDPAFSVRMGVDHGIVQPYQVLWPGLDVPVVPVMVNCSADPRPSFRRCFDFGLAVGDAVRALPGDRRVLVLASGGLSHWVKALSVEDEALDASTREYLVDGRDRVDAYNASREESLAQRIADGHEGPVNAEWDRWFLDRLAAGDHTSLLAMDSRQVEETAGNGAHEVRAWLAAWAAWGGPVEVLGYEAVPRWVTGMGVVVGSAQL